MVGSTTAKSVRLLSPPPPRRRSTPEDELEVEEIDPSPPPPPSSPNSSPSVTDSNRPEMPPTTAVAAASVAATKQVLNINSSDTIMLGDEGGCVEWMADEGHEERQCGPRLQTDRGTLEMFITDTVLKQKKNPLKKSITRKLNQVRWFGSRTSKSRKPFRTDISIHQAREYVDGLDSLVRMAELNPKPNYPKFCQLESQDRARRLEEQQQQQLLQHQTQHQQPFRVLLDLVNAGVAPAVAAVAAVTAPAAAAPVAVEEKSPAVAAAATAATAAA